MSTEDTTPDENTRDRRMADRLFPPSCPRCGYSGREIIRYRGRRIRDFMLGAFAAGVAVCAAAANLPGIVGVAGELAAGLTR